MGSLSVWIGWKVVSIGLGLIRYAQSQSREMVWKLVDRTTPQIYKLSEMNQLPLTPDKITDRKVSAVINTVAIKSVT